MKKRIYSILISISMMLPGYAQNVSYGVKGGLNLSDIVITNYINPDAESDYNIKAGLHGGFFGIADLTEKISLKVELLYSNKGVSAGDRINLHYINIPILIEYAITKSFITEIGPELGYLFSARSPYGDVSNTWNNKLDIGLDGGLQFVISKDMRAGLRYYAGFSSVIDSIDESGTNNVPTEETIKYQNRVLQLYVSYTLGRKDTP